MKAVHLNLSTTYLNQHQLTALLEAARRNRNLNSLNLSGKLEFNERSFALIDKMNKIGRWIVDYCYIAFFVPVVIILNLKKCIFFIREPAATVC